MGERGAARDPALAQAGVELVVPPLSIRCEPPVAVVDAVVDRRGTRALAEAYLSYLFSPEGQEIVARHFYRPHLEEVAARYRADFPAVEVLTVEQVAGDWATAHALHFADGGLFDRLTKVYRPSSTVYHWKRVNLHR